MKLNENYNGYFDITPKNTPFSKTVCKVVDIVKIWRIVQNALCAWHSNIIGKGFSFQYNNNNNNNNGKIDKLLWLHQS